MESINSLRPKKARQVKSKVKSMIIILTSMRLFAKNSSWQAKQSIPNITVMFHGSCMKIAKTLPRKLTTKNWLLHHDNAPTHTSFFIREFFTQNNMTVISQPPYLPLFLHLKINLKGCHFDATEVIEAESQVVLNHLTEHYFQDSFKKE
jgi:hypothetical protein